MKNFNGRFRLDLLQRNFGFLAFVFFLVCVFWFGFEGGEKQTGIGLQGGNGLVNFSFFLVWSLSYLVFYRIVERKGESSYLFSYIFRCLAFVQIFEGLIYNFNFLEVVFGVCIFCLLFFTYLIIVEYIFLKIEY